MPWFQLVACGLLAWSLVAISSAVVRRVLGDTPVATLTLIAVRMMSAMILILAVGILSSEHKVPLVFTVSVTYFAAIVADAVPYAATWMGRKQVWPPAGS